MLLKEELKIKMMKSTGIVRKVDELGRIVLPMELRRTLGINEKDPLEIYVDQEKIILSGMCNCHGRSRVWEQ
jgi:transcriptional pleiotropic regulator of transition state genes